MVYFESFHTCKSSLLLIYLLINLLLSGISRVRQVLNSNRKVSTLFFIFSFSEYWRITDYYYYFLGKLVHLSRVTARRRRQRRAACGRRLDQGRGTYIMV